MNDKIPIVRTYSGFFLVWIVVQFVVCLVCIALFMSGRWILGIVTILAAVFLYFRHGLSIAGRRRYPEQRTEAD